MKKSEAYRILNALKKCVDSLDDITACNVVFLFKRMQNDNSLISAGTRICHNGVLYKATTDLWDLEQYNPDNSPSLWEIINYKDGYRVIPEVITVTSIFSKGEIGWWNDVLYVSLIDNNAWTPAAYPGGWELYNK